MEAMMMFLVSKMSGREPIRKAAERLAGFGHHHFSSDQWDAAHSKVAQ